MILNLDGFNFTGQPSACLGRAPECIQWDHDCASDAPTVHLDWQIVEAALHGKGPPRSKKYPHYGWILETPETTFPLEDLVRKGTLGRTFEKIFTHSTRLVKEVSSCVWVPASGVWVQDVKLHPKTKNCSMITSPKASLPGHRRRLQWAQALQGHVDLFGLHSRIASKEEGLCDYRFSVAIENAVAPGYFTEKILDCFATGTVPVYLGAPDIGDFFNAAGIVRLESVRDWGRLMPGLYDSMRPFIEDNFRRVQEFFAPEKWIESHFAGGIK